jgi:hypothetical protein
LSLRRAGLWLVAAVLAASVPASAQTGNPPGVERPALITAPFTFGGPTAFGSLRFMGGVFLTTPKYKLFGGLTGLESETLADGSGVRFAGVTNQGYFLTFRGALDSAGQLVAASNLTLAPLRDTTGEVLKGKGETDAEDVSRPPDANGWLVSFEGHNRVLAYVDPFDPNADVIGLNIPAAAKKLRAQHGLEAIAALPGGRVAVGAEDGRLWLCPPKQEPCGQIHAKGGLGALFLLTGLDYLPGTTDELVAVYRRPGPLGGYESKVTHVVLQGGVATETLLGDLPNLAGNVSGVTAVARPGGGYRLYLVTNNNFQPDTATAVIAFDWTP